MSYSIPTRCPCCGGVLTRRQRIGLLRAAALGAGDAGVVALADKVLATDPARDVAPELAAERELCVLLGTVPE